MKPYYQTVDVCFYHGDSVQILPALPDASIDMVFTDPPYGHNNNDGDLIHNWEKCLPARRPAGWKKGMVDTPRPISNDGAVEAGMLFRKSVRQFDRLLARGGCCCCCCGGGGGPDPQFARWSLWLDKVLDFKQMVVWDKGPMGMGWHYRRSYETVLVATKRGGPCKWYDKTDRIENVIRPGYHGIRKKIPKASDHPTEKPHTLAAHFIRLHTEKGETVLDPFAGYATTGVACILTGRKFIGIELDEKFCERAVKRLEKAKRGFSLLEKPQPRLNGKTTPLFEIGKNTEAKKC